MKPVVSVVIPNYNYGRYLDQRIQTVLNQSYQDFELILLDDASTDNSIDILQKYKNDKHVSHVVVNERNTGSPFQQWMKGILLAEGEWVWIAEADDVSEPTFLEDCLRAVHSYQDVSICMVGSDYIDGNGKVIRRNVDYWGKNSMKTVIFSGREYIRHKLYWHCCIMNASGVLFKRGQALNLQNSIFLTMRYSGDWMFWFEMARQGCVVEVRKTLNHFRQHEAKVSVEGISTGNRIREDIDVVSLIEQSDIIIGKYKRKLARGMLYRKIKKVGNIQKRNELFLYLKEKLGGDKSDLSVLHWNQYLQYLCPFLVTMKRDRKK